MTQPTNTLVAAADYADALIVARRIKRTLCTLLFFLLGTTLTLFALLRYWPKMQSLVGAGPFDGDASKGRAVLSYFVALMDIAALVLPALLVAFVVTILLVQVVARVVGAGRTVSALGWAVLLAILLFPWQAVLNNPANSSDAMSTATGMKLPGVVYTWAEVSHPAVGARFAEVNATPATPADPASAEHASVDRATDKLVAVLHWARYGLFPLLAMVILGIVHTKTERGLRQSFGADQLPTTPDDDVLATTVNAPQL